jgi:hypothetical protein
VKRGKKDRAHLAALAPRCLLANLDPAKTWFVELDPARHLSALTALYRSQLVGVVGEQSELAEKPSSGGLPGGPLPSTRSWPWVVLPGCSPKVARSSCAPPAVREYLPTSPCSAVLRCAPTQLALSLAAPNAGAVMTTRVATIMAAATDTPSLLLNNTPLFLLPQRGVTRQPHRVTRRRHSNKRPIPCTSCT